MELHPELAVREKSCPVSRCGGDDESSAAYNSLVVLLVGLVLLAMRLDGGSVRVMHD